MTDKEWTVNSRGTAWRLGAYAIVKDRPDYHQPYCLFKDWRSIGRFSRLSEAKDFAEND